MKMNKIVVFALALAQLAWASPTSASQAVDYRLPPGITPTAQRIHLRLDPSVPTYSGTTTIRITLADAKDSIGIYQVGLELTSIELKGHGGTRKLDASAGEWDIHWLSDGDEIPAGDYELAISFSGGYATDSLGMHRVSYEGRDYVYTQMEDMYARRVFPLFDEPSFKIPWNLTITAPKGLTVIANTPVERVEEEDGVQHVSFRETKPLPSYLLAFAVGPMDRVPLPGMSVPGYVYTPAGGTDQLGFVLRETHRIVAALEDYFGSSYPFAKLDFVAVPEFAFGAMENPGLITYRTDLLMVGDEVSGDSALSVLMVIAHEVAHIWYGDVVTMNWWDDLWLNEAFASWMAWSTIAELYPELEAQLNLPQTRAFVSDQKATAKAIRRTVRNSKEVFDNVGLNYSKGHALLRMLEAYVGRETWQKGIREYIRRYAWRNAVADDLWAVVSEVSGLDVGRIANDYLNQPGVPLVTVDTSGDVSQRRYVVPGEEAAPQTWQIPMNVKYKEDGDVRETFYLLEDEAGTLDLPATAEWIFPDAAGNAYFRWTTTVDQFYALMDDVGLLSARERIALIDNVQALFGAELLPLADYLYALEILLRDPHPLVFLPALEQLKTIGDQFIDDTTRGLFSEFVDDALSERFAAAGVESHPDDSEALRRMRPRLLRMLGQYGADPAAREAADALTRRFLAKPDSVETDLAKEALRVSALNDDGSLYDDYIRVYREAGTADRKSAILQSIYFQNPKILERHLGFLLTDAVSGRDALTSISYSSSVLEDKQQLYDWLDQNLGKLMARLPAYAYSYLPQALGGGCDSNSLEQLERFFAERERFADGLEKVRLGSKACIRRKQKHLADLKSYLAARDEDAVTGKAARPIGDGQYTDPAGRYYVDVDIPASTNSNAVADIEAFLQSKLDEVVAMTAEEPEPGYFETHRYELQSSWELAESDSLYTFVVRGHTYTGGAHNMPFVATFTYSKDDDRRVRLRDILSDDSSLGEIARQARLHFGQYEADGPFADGLRTEWDNWERWFVSNARITFLFPVYQVAPFADGEQSFSLPVESATRHLFVEDYFVPWVPPIAVFDDQGHGPDPGSEEFVRAAAFQRVRTSQAYTEHGHSLQTHDARKSDADDSWLVDYSWQDRRDPDSLYTGTVRVTGERADFVASAFRVVSPYSADPPQSR